MKSYFEEFDRKYNQPHMDSITVGFSGIDPSPKAESEFSTIDCGEITLDGEKTS